MKLKRILKNSMLRAISVFIIIGSFNVTNTISKAKENTIPSIQAFVGSNHIVSFKDKSLEYAVRYKINKPMGNILESDLVNVKNLNLKYKTVEHLDDLQYFTNLESIYLNGSYVNDLSPLKNLKKLHHLSLTLNYPIKNYNMAVLGDLTNLESLDLSHGKINDLPFLSNMT
ncbi:leucine-rich repeat domain-containing protein [Clostridium scatologenes]|uniref:Surface-layer protein n=1 Tax=Clostridium scatologenes TaxID=1548 RepID=A0A0E3M8D4_CLOSL|nr:leucine-rich repeat domain-containing protein [Clostridium scatologenes]AKA69672.1 surface-layer protein [Clostridium scatologenes]